MKKHIDFILMACLLVITIASCKKDDDSSSSNSTVTLGTRLMQGNWKVTLFNDNGNIETSHFTGYEFHFQTGGVVTATNSGNTVSGLWSVSDSNSQLELILDFGSIANFSDLNEDWHIRSQSSAKIETEHISGGNGGTDLLTFEKI